MGLLEAVDRNRSSFREEVRKAIARDKAAGLPSISIHDDEAFADYQDRNEEAALEERRVAFRTGR